MTPQNSKKHVTYLECDVLTMAKERIRYLIDQFDSLWVAYSGGKDSLVVLTLVEEVYAELGIKEKVNIVFRDEELIQDCIVDFVRSFAESGKYNFRYLAVPMKVGKFIMGKHVPFTAWDKDREWHRQPPPYAEVQLPSGEVADENNMDSAVFQGYKGRIAVLTGVRADESLKRYMACVGKVEDNYISRTTAKNVWTAKPIYDWEESDVFKFFYEHGISYCPVYNSQMWAGTALRVASTLHERAQPQLFAMKTMYPMYYQTLVSLMPEIETHYRYYKDMDKNRVYSEYAHSWEGIRQYIRECLGVEYQEDALEYVDKCERWRKNNEVRDPTAMLGNLPVLYVFKTVVGGSFVKAAIFPVSATQEDLDYESVQEIDHAI